MRAPFVAGRLPVTSQSSREPIIGRPLTIFFQRCVENGRPHSTKPKEAGNWGFAGLLSPHAKTLEVTDELSAADL
jgi:hypothetical protein